MLVATNVACPLAFDRVFIASLFGVVKGELKTPNQIAYIHLSLSPHLHTPSALLRPFRYHIPSNSIYTAMAEKNTPPATQIQDDGGLITIDHVQLLAKLTEQQTETFMKRFEAKGPVSSEQIKMAKAMGAKIAAKTMAVVMETAVSAPTSAAAQAHEKSTMVSPENRKRCGSSSALAASTSTSSSTAASAMATTASNANAAGGVGTATSSSRNNGAGNNSGGSTASKKQKLLPPISRKPAGMTANVVGNPYLAAAAASGSKTSIPSERDGVRKLPQEIINKASKYRQDIQDRCLLCEKWDCTNNCEHLQGICVLCCGGHWLFSCPNRGSPDHNKNFAITQSCNRNLEFGCTFCYVIDDISNRSLHSSSNCRFSKHSMRMEGVFMFGYYYASDPKTRPNTFSKYLSKHFSSKDAWTREFVRIVDHSNDLRAQASAQNN